MSCRLLYLVGQLGPGGSERQLCYLLQAIDRERYKPAVAIWNYCVQDVYLPRIQELNIPLYSFSRTLSAAAKLREFRRLVRELKPEVVHSYSFYTNFAAHWAAWERHAIAFGSIRSDFVLDRENDGPWLGRLNSCRPRNQICNNSSAAETIRYSQSLFIPRQLYVVRNGLDLECFRSVPLATLGQVRIVGVGSLFPVKRWDRLLVAALELKRKGFDYQMQIAGNGPLRWSLKQQARHLGLADRIKFVGHINDIRSLLSDSTFLVLVSDHEGCPNAVMEAMASGRAVVATDVGDIPYLVDDGKTGFIVRRGDDAMLAERLATLLTNRDLCRRMGEAGRVKAEREFGLDRLVAETLAAYRASGWKET